MGIGEVARLLDVTPDMLRNWERDRLVQVPSQQKKRYRIYGRTEIDRLRVIRMLRKARYSTMSILRMMRQLDLEGDLDGEIDVREVFDTPSPDEDVVTNSNCC